MLCNSVSQQRDLCSLCVDLCRSSTKKMFSQLFDVHEELRSLLCECVCHDHGWS